jgi:hypothetical protein
MMMMITSQNSIKTSLYSAHQVSDSLRQAVYGKLTLDRDSLTLLSGFANLALNICRQ